MRGLSPVAASGGHSSLRCAGLSLSRPLLLRSTGSRRAGSVIAAHGPSCSAACGIFPDQGLNLCPLHWQADSQPLCYQGSPTLAGLTWRMIQWSKKSSRFGFLGFLSFFFAEAFVCQSSYVCFLLLSGRQEILEVETYVLVKNVPTKECSTWY